MARERKINVKVDTSNLPKKGNRIDWKKSIGYKVKFIYEDLSGEIEIVDRLDNGRLLLKYKDRTIEMESGNLIQGYLGKLLGVITNEFKYNIGDIIEYKGRKLTIINKYKKLSKENKRDYYYKYYDLQCDKCNTIISVVEGNINKKNRNWANCNCNNGFRYPEKIMFSILTQLYENCKIKKFKIHKTFEWENNKEYDFYIELNNGETLIIETHGMQHYGYKNLNNKSFSHNSRSLREEQINDSYKCWMAYKNGINNYVQLDCRKSELEWIKNSIENSILNELFDLSIINWGKCEEYINSNIVLDVCEYWKQEKKNNKYLTTLDVAKHFGIGKTTVLNYLNFGNRNELCVYNGEEELYLSHVKGSIIAKNKISIKIKIYMNEIFIGIFESLSSITDKGYYIFNTYMDCDKISKACRKNKTYKGFTFEYATNEEYEEFKKEHPNTIEYMKDKYLQIIENI